MYCTEAWTTTQAAIPRGVLLDLEHCSSCSGAGQGHRCQGAQGGLGVLDGILDNFDDVLELGTAGVADGLVHPALAGGDGDALGAETGEGEGDFLLVATTHGVGEDVDFDVAATGRRRQGVEGGLGDANVGFDADEDDFCCCGVRF